MENKLNLTPELLEQAKTATSAAALLAMAQEKGITLTAEEAENLYTIIHAETCALSDDELDKVAGGIFMGRCPKCGEPTAYLITNEDPSYIKCLTPQCGYTKLYY